MYVQTFSGLLLLEQGKPLAPFGHSPAQRAGVLICCMRTFYSLRLSILYVALLEPNNATVVKMDSSLVVTVLTQYINTSPDERALRLVLDPNILLEMWDFARSMRRLSSAIERNSQRNFLTFSHRPLSEVREVAVMPFVLPFSF